MPSLRKIEKIRSTQKLTIGVKSNGNTSKYYHADLLINGSTLYPSHTNTKECIYKD